MCRLSAGSLIAWTKKRPKKRTRSRRRKTRKSTRKSMRVVTVQVTLPKAAAAATVTAAQIQKAAESSKAEIKRRARKKIPVGITAPKLSAESRVKRHRRAGAGH